MTRDEALAILKRFKERHGAEYGLTAIGLFGSLARDAATEDSDIDVVFQTERPNLFRASRMRQELETMMGRRVDIVRLRDRMNPHLKQRILRDARYA